MHRDRHPAIIQPPGRRTILGVGGVGFAMAVFSGCRLAKASDITKATDNAEQFSRFLPRGFDSGRDDAAQAIENAAKWSSRNMATVIVEGRYLLGRTARIDSANASLLFLNSEMVLTEDIPISQTRSRGSIKAGLHILADKVSLNGKCRLAGQGIAGKTFLQGLFAEEADDLTLGMFDLANLAIGQHFMACDRVKCGNTTANRMWGLQKSGSGTAGAGTAQVISGCRNAQFGKLLASENDKNGRYLSVGVHSQAGPRDNEDNDYDRVEVSGRRGSNWSQATGIRSSVNSRFAGGSGSGLSFLLLCQKYRTDDAYQITGNDFGDWTGQIIDSEGSVDAAAAFFVEPGAREIGSNRLGRIVAQCALQTKPTPSGYSQTFGLHITSGQLVIDSLDFEGFTFHLHASNCHLVVDTVMSKKAAFQPMQYGRGVTGRIRLFSIVSGLSGSDINAGLIRSMDAGPRGKSTRFEIDRVDCSGSSCDRADYVLYDGVLPRGSLQIGTLNGRARRGKIWYRP